MQQYFFKNLIERDTRSTKKVKMVGTSGMGKKEEE